MSNLRLSVLAAGLLAATSSCLSFAAIQDHVHDHQKIKQAPRPMQRAELPPSVEQTKFNLPISKSDQQKLFNKSNRQNKTLIQANSASMALATPDCKDMNKLASYSGAALADYLVNLPDYECTYGLFSLTPTQAASVYSASNLNTIVSRFSQEASAYNASNIRLVNLALYLRAGFYLASGSVIPKPASSVVTNLRTPIQQLVYGSALYQSNPVGPSTAGEVMKLITNLNDEVFYLPSMKNVIERFTRVC